MKRLMLVLGLLSLVSCSPKSEIKPAVIKNASIMNGIEVSEKDPLASSIVGVYNTKEQSICTGSLIAPNIVLTAAHCTPERASQVKIVFSNDIDYIMNTREQDILMEFTLSATDFKVSPDWDETNETIEFDTGDIALIKFKGVIPAGFKPALMLKESSDLKIGAIVTVAGFGVNEVKSKRIDPRKYRNLEDAIASGEVICEEKECFEIETYGDGVLRVTNAPINALYDTEVQLDEKKSGTCSGDSGGPAYLLQNGIYYLFGVTSRGSALCNEVGVYTNALYYSSWIAETSKLLK